MLKIRLSRTGKKSQPSFRILVQEHSVAVKGGKFVEIVGHYHPATPNKDLVLKKERVEYWLSKGAQPTDTMAGILKRNGFSGMDKFIGRRDLQAKKKKAVEEEEAPAAPVVEKAEAPAEEAKPEEVAETPAEEKAEAKEEAPAEETPAEEAKNEEPVAEEAAESKEEAASEEAAPVEEPEKEEAPA